MTAVLAVTATSCVYDKGDEPDVPDDTTLVSMTIQLPGMRTAAAAGTGYESGAGYENYIEISADGMRIYMFDTDNKLLMRFVPTSVTDNGGNTYTVVGKLPAELETISNFKMVVLANWPAYTDDAALTPGTTTIDDLVKAETAQYTGLTNFVLNPAENRVIPFYGVHEYKDVAIRVGMQNKLSEPVALLRAMAKVEVVLDTPGASLSSVSMRGFNPTGYCAPQGVYSQSDYDHNGQWEQDYVKTLHLPGGFNNADAANAVLPLYRSKEADGEQKETWICYAPEYCNTRIGDVATNFKARLELMVYGIDKDAPYEIFFADYDANGILQAGTDFDIQRNNCYRFIVKLSHGGLIIKVMKWENTYDNDFIF